MPTKGLRYSIIHRLVATVFTKLCTCTAFVWYLLRDATITQHKRNTNIQELRTLPNTLLTIYMDALRVVQYLSTQRIRYLTAQYNFRTAY
jgi:hypothetical protein